jgi:hypothetical protein
MPQTVDAQDPNHITEPELVVLAVNGTLMRGFDLNTNLLDVGAHFLREACTAPAYRLWSIHDRHPAMVRVSAGGASIALELWVVPPAGIASVLQREPPGLCIGRIELEDGNQVLGVLGEPDLVEGQREITRWGGWRSYADSRKG